MAEVSYVYKTAAFVGLVPGGHVQTGALQREVRKSAIASATLEYINTEEVGGQIDYILFFDGPLSAADKTLLDGVVEAHEGETETTALQYAQTEEEQSTTDTSWQNAVRKNCRRLATGYFLVQWYGEFRVGNGALADKVEARMRWGNVTLGEFENDGAVNQSFTGWMIVADEGGTKPVAKLQYRLQGGGGDTAFVRRARVMVNGMELED